MSTKIGGQDISNHLTVVSSRYYFSEVHTISLNCVHTFLFVLAAGTICANNKECRAAAKELGYVAGGQGFKFASPTHSTKGCYSYSTGKFRGHVFYGTGGKLNQRKTQLKPPKFRVRSASCSGTSPDWKKADLLKKNFKFFVTKKIQ